MLGKCDQMEFSQFVGIARRIWLRHNEVIHGGTFLHPNTIVQQATQAVEIYQTLRVGTLRYEAPIGTPTTLLWKAPPLGWYKVNWDAGVNHTKGRVGLEAIIWDHQGKMWALKSLTRHGFLDPTTVETMAATIVVKFCKEMGIMQVLLEGDAKLVVDAVNSWVPNESG